MTSMYDTTAESEFRKNDKMNKVLWEQHGGYGRISQLWKEEQGVDIRNHGYGCDFAAKIDQLLMYCYLQISILLTKFKIVQFL